MPFQYQSLLWTGYKNAVGVFQKLAIGTQIGSQKFIGNSNSRAHGRADALLAHTKDGENLCQIGRFHINGAGDTEVFVMVNDFATRGIDGVNQIERLLAM